MRRLLLFFPAIVLALASRPASSFALVAPQQQQDTVAGVVVDSIGGRPIIAGEAAEFVLVSV